MKDLVLILGPMSSGKSFDLIGFFAPLRIANRKYVLVQPKLNCREDSITSRNGNVLESIKIERLKEIEKFSGCEVIGIDEVHLFSDSDTQKTSEDLAVIGEMLKKGIKFVISGLDMDYQGNQFPIINKLFELAPSEIRMKTAVCMKCKSLEAKYTQVMDKQRIVATGGLDSRLPDNGAYIYEPRCRQCFVKGQQTHIKTSEIVSRW